ncbi:LLM class flavin-dependent oxidoreductase [Nocardia callitridis]|uniref:LLM class flavin-dependent oxidoreductase n=1 Tax=Nocardia callitridis TaxID=648753 RepID=UPI0031E523BC
MGGPSHSAAEWRQYARRVEDLGYSTLSVPDALGFPAPLPTLAVAATATTALRVGTFVLASTVREPRMAAWEANSLTTLTDNRFEFGIGTGNPRMNQAAVDEIGLPSTTFTQRLDRVRQTITHLRELGAETPVLIAAGGPKSRALAGAVADIVTLPHGPFATREEIDHMVAATAEAAGSRADQIEYNMNILVHGDAIPPWVVPLVGDDLDALIKADSLLMLRGTPREIADELQRRRDRFGSSYITVNGYHLETFAPVVELLRDK